MGITAVYKKMLCSLIYFDVSYLLSCPFILSIFSSQSHCSSGPCQNGGTCIPQYEKDSYVCVCVKGLTGKDCQTGDGAFH